MAKATKQTPAKRAGTQVALPDDWQKKLAQYAQKAKQTSEAFGGGGSWLSFKGGVLSYKGATVPNNETEVVVLDSVLENLFYVDKFDPNTPAQPVCYAFGYDKDEMAPHEKAPDKQHDRCATCANNKFGSADTGRGKACKNQVRLALIPYGDGSYDALAEGELTFAKLPPTSGANWTTFVGATQAQYPDLATFAHRIRVKVVPDPKAQFKVQFTHLERLSQEQLAAVFSRVAEAEAAIVPADPFPPIEAPAQPAPRGRSVKTTPVARGRKY